MSHTPPVGWPDVVTKRDLDAFGDRIEAILCRELRAFRRDMTAQLAAQTRFLIFFTAGLVVTVAGIAFAAAQLG